MMERTSIAGGRCGKCGRHHWDDGELAGQELLPASRFSGWSPVRNHALRTDGRLFNGPIAMRNNPLTETPTKLIRSKYSRDQWEVVACVETGMVFLRNPPEYSALVEDLAWERTFELETVRRRETEPILNALSTGIKRVRLSLKKTDRITRVALQFWRKTGDDADHDRFQLVDVGCGDGRIMIGAIEYFSAKGIHFVPTGIEISRALSIRAHEAAQVFGGRCLQKSGLEGLEELPADFADLMFLCSYLEHEVHPLAVLRECRRVLRSGGIALVKVPNFASWNRIVRQRRWCGFRYPDHVNYFTPATLRALVENAGLRILRMNWLDRIPTNDSMYAVISK